MKVYVIQSKYGIMMNVSVSVKKKKDWVFVKIIIYGIPECVIVNVIDSKID